MHINIRYYVIIKIRRKRDILRMKKNTEMKSYRKSTIKKVIRFQVFSRY